MSEDDTAQPPATVDSPADDASPEPDETPPAKKPRKRWKRVLIVLGIVFVVLLGGGAIGAWALVNRYEGKVTHADLLGDAAQPKASAEAHFRDGPVNLLMLGSDSRAGEVGKGKVAGERSDTIMLVHVSAKHDKAAIISIPRDSYVNIPAGGSWKGGKNKINAAFAFGGAPLAAKTITELTGIPLDGAMIANFAGIRTMVDAVGGVNVCVPYDVKSYFSKTVWTKGCHDMDGPTAEEFMRNRMYVPGGDLGRVKDQQLVVQAIIKKVSDQGVLNNPLVFDKLLVTAASSLTIDKTLDLRLLATAVKSIRPDNVTFGTVPVSNVDLKTSAGSSVQLNAALCAELFTAIKNDTVWDWIAAHPAPPDGS
jgi:LCP family protein required for cell wall assembly